MKNFLWKYRIVVGFLALLLVQVPFVVCNLTGAIAEAAQILISSGLAGYWFSKTFESVLENKLYGKFRRNWKEVRVMYSDFAGRGAGEYYPREPTLLIQAPIFEEFGPDAPLHMDENPLRALDFDGKNHQITAAKLHGPMSVSFNTGYVGEPADGENTWATGDWSELQLMKVGPPGLEQIRAGFPDTLVMKGRAPA